MANGRIFRVARLTDKQAVSLFEELSQKLDKLDVTYTFGDGLSQNKAEFDARLLKSRSYAINSISAVSSSRSVSITLNRGITTSNGSTRLPSSFADEITVKLPSQTNRTAAALDVAVYIELIHIIETQTKQVVDESLENETDTEGTILKTELLKLSELASDLTIGADRKRRELDSKQDELQARFDQKEEALAQKNAAELVNIEQARTELEEIKKQLDDREHKHVRRELRETITDRIQQSLDGSKGSRTARNYSALVIYICLSGALLSGALTYAAQASIDTNTMINVFDGEGNIVGQTLASGFQVYATYAKIFLGGAVTLGFIVFAINWAKKLSIQEDAYHRDLERYVFDMNRASWTIETILELTDAELEEVPSVWLESVCHGLFSSTGDVGDEPTSLDALAALLNVTSEAEIGPDGPKFKLNKRAAQRAAASAG